MKEGYTLEEVVSYLKKILISELLLREHTDNIDLTTLQITACKNPASFIYKIKKISQLLYTFIYSQHHFSMSNFQQVWYVT